jgi:hypothetical protein
MARGSQGWAEWFPSSRWPAPTTASAESAPRTTARVLVYFWTCERCDARLGDAGRERYRPSFDPHGPQRFQASLGR